MTSELKNELQLLRMRGAFDTKRFYRTSDYAKGLPKFFQVGTVIDDPLDPAASSGRRRPKTMVREMLDDPKLRRRAKARFKKVSCELPASPQGSRVEPRVCPLVSGAGGDERWPQEYQQACAERQTESQRQVSDERAHCIRVRSMCVARSCIKIYNRL